MPQHKIKKNSNPNILKKKQTVAKLQKVQSRNARKAGMVMKKKKTPAAQNIKLALHKAMTRKIEEEMSVRARAAACKSLKIVGKEEEGTTPARKNK